MFNFFKILRLLILQSSPFLSWWSFQQQNKILTRVNYQVGANYKHRTCPQLWLLPAWEVRRANSHTDLGLLFSARENWRERPELGPAKSYSDPMSTGNGVWPRIFDNFEILKFYQVLLSNNTMIFLGTGTTGWERISYWRLLFFSTSKQKLLINVKASHRIILRLHLARFQYWWGQLDQLDYGRTELIFTVFYC